MLNFFQYINNILFTKNKRNVGKEQCNESMGSFMLNRWCSFYDKENCQIINESSNRQHLTEDFDLLSKFLFVFLPKKSYKKINYINKNKDKKQDPLPILSKNMELGTRDMQLLFRTLNEKDLENVLQIYSDS